MSEMKSLAVPRAELTAGDLSDELWREYHFPDGTVHHITQPKVLYTHSGGTTHRIVDANGLVHCVAFPGPSGSVILIWQPATSATPAQS